MRITAEARPQLQSLPRPIRARVLAVFEKLAGWPEVSGVKRLKDRSKAPIAFGRVTGACCSPPMSKLSASSCFALQTAGTFTTTEVRHDCSDHHTQRQKIRAGAH